jgi:DNA-binding transcriptional MocR family regulator
MRTNERHVLTSKQRGPWLTLLTGRSAYLQIADDIRSQIVGGALRGNDRLPSEPELMTDYGVSRIVVRQALGRAEAEGLIVKQQGRGSFVREQQPPTRRGSIAVLRPAGILTVRGGSGGQRRERRMGLPDTAKHRIEG